MDAVHVMVIGATGTFGRLLAGQLVREPGVSLVLAGRNIDALERARRELGGAARVAMLDRDVITAADLRDVDMVIDAAGPFQHSHTCVIEAAIGAGCHYVDMADGREFVAGIGRFDEVARARQVAVVSGASSTPGLAHAVLDRLVSGWMSVAAVRATISPGSAVRGLSLVRGVLSYLGRPVRVFRDGGWGEAPGWGATRTVDIAGLRRGPASLCETPDLDLFVDRYHPQLAAEFLSSLEVRPMHLGLSIIGLLVRGGLLRRPERHARLFRALAGLFAPLGRNQGGMLVEVSGRDESGAACFARWTMRAPPGVGPTVPTLAALALVRRLRDCGGLEPGARPCAGVLDLFEFEQDFDRLGIDTVLDRRAAPTPLFAQALGRDFDALPAVNRCLHAPAPALILEGEAEVEGAERPLGRHLARLFDLPQTQPCAPLRVVIEATPDGRELWSRLFQHDVMRSVMENPDPATRTVWERFGAFRFRLRLDPSPDGLAMVLAGGRLWRMSLPAVLLPRIKATEWVESERHRFDVSIELPVLGRLARYRGWLR